MSNTRPVTYSPEEVDITCVFAGEGKSIVDFEEVQPELTDDVFSHTQSASGFTTRIKNAGKLGVIRISVPLASTTNRILTEMFEHSEDNYHRSDSFVDVTIKGKPHEGVPAMKAAYEMPFGTVKKPASPTFAKDPDNVEWEIEGHFKTFKSEGFGYIDD